MSGKSAGSAAEILVNYGFGMGSGDVTIRMSNNKLRAFYVTKAPISIDNRVVNCPVPARAGFAPANDICPKWPAYMEIGSTRIRVFYWQRQRFGKPTLATDRLTVVR